MPGSYIEMESKRNKNVSSNTLPSDKKKILNDNSMKKFITEEKNFFVMHLESSALLYADAYKNSYSVLPTPESKIKSKINQACIKSVGIVFNILDEHLKSLDDVENNYLSHDNKIDFHKKLIIKAHRTMMEEVIRHTQQCIISDTLKEIRPINSSEDPLKYMIYVCEGEPIKFMERMSSTFLGIGGALLGFILFPIAIGCAIYSYKDNINRERYTFNKNFQISTEESSKNTFLDEDSSCIAEEPSHKNFNSLNALHDSRKFNMIRGKNIKDPSCSSNIRDSSNNNSKGPR